jgi:HD-GYP domain
MTFTNPVLNEKKRKIDEIYLNLHQRIRAHSVHVGVVTSIMAHIHPQRLMQEYMLEYGEIGAAIMCGGDYHDIGKYLISYAICRKNDALSGIEKEIFMQHPRYSVKLIEEFSDVLFDPDESGRGALKLALDMAKYHHERYDGSGYPTGISGDSIPFIAQLCGLADAFDTLANTRQRGRFELASSMIFENRGILFSPAAVECFELSMVEIRRLYTTKNSWIRAGMREAGADAD